MELIDAVDRFKNSLSAYYNLEEMDVEHLVVRADYFEHDESFAVSKKVNLWSADSEEFLYLFNCEKLTDDIYESCMKFVDGDWKTRAHIQKGHMYTYVTPVFFCSSAENSVLKKLKRCRIYRNFRFALWGWMEYHTACFVTGENKIFSNVRGRCVRKTLKKLFFNK